MRAYTDAEIVEFLCRGGIPLDSNFFVGEAGAEVITLYLPEIGFRHRIIENDELGCACKAFLDRRWARHFRNLTELYSTVHAERWPGWEQHAPVAH